MTRSQTRCVEVIGVGTPPPLALRPLVDEVFWRLAQGREPSGGSIDDSRPGGPGAERARRTPREGASDRRERLVCRFAPSRGAECLLQLSDGRIGLPSSQLDQGGNLGPSLLTRFLFDRFRADIRDQLSSRLLVRGASMISAPTPARSTSFRSQLGKDVERSSAGPRWRSIC